MHFCSPIHPVFLSFDWCRRKFQNGSYVSIIADFWSFVSPQFFTFEKSRHPTLAKLLFFYFMLFVTVLLMNMLIAMMANTYQNVSKEPSEFAFWALIDWRDGKFWKLTCPRSASIFTQECKWVVAICHGNLRKCQGKACKKYRWKTSQNAGWREEILRGPLTKYCRETWQNAAGNPDKCFRETWLNAVG